MDDLERNIRNDQTSKPPRLEVGPEALSWIQALGLTPEVQASGSHFHMSPAPVGRTVKVWNIVSPAAGEGKHINYHQLVSVT